MERNLRKNLKTEVERGSLDQKSLKDSIPSRLFGALKATTQSRVVMDLWADGRCIKAINAEILAQEALSVASYLADAGVTHGDRVIITGPTGPDWCVSYLGVVSLGAVAVPVDPELPDDDMSIIIRDSEASVVIHGPAWEPAGALDPDVVMVSMADPALRDKEWPGDEMPWFKVSGDDLASLIYTSGTTGRPKGVMLSHGNFLSNADSIMALGILGPSDHILGILPLHHVYPFMESFIGPLIAGASITFLQSLKGPEIVETMNKAGVTILPGVPRLFALMYQAMSQKIDASPGPARKLFNTLAGLTGFLRRRTGINIGRILFAPVHRRFGRKFRFFVSGGAKLDTDVAVGLESLGFEIYEGYGLTETSPAAAFNRPGARRTGSVGQAIPGVSLMIDEKVGEGGGEIMISGPNVMQGYYRNEAETSAVLRDGWFRTGDLGYMDDDGYLFITGRSKEVIVLSSGKNVFPEDVEKRFLREPLIEEICIFASTGSEAVEALILPAFASPDLKGKDYAGIWQALREVVERVSDELPPYQRPRGFRVIREPLPRTPLGKLRRFQVMEILDKAERHQAEKPVSADDKRMMDSPSGRAVLQALKPAVMDGSMAIRPDHDIEFDLGIDSLGRVELLSMLGVADSTEGEDVRTVRDLINSVSRVEGGAGTSGIMPAGWSEILARGPDQEDLAVMSARERKSVFVRALRTLVISIVRGMFRMHVKGSENIPGEGPFIIAANHTSYLDGFFVGAAVPRPVLLNLYTIGLEEYFRGALSSVLTSTAHVIPIDTEKHLDRAMRMSAHVLGSGRILSIFPEGGRSFDGELMEFRKGVGILSVELDVPIVPCFIKGAFEAWSRHMLLPKPFNRVSLVFGRPVYPAEVIGTGEGMGQDEKYSLVVDRLKQDILAMR